MIASVSADLVEKILAMRRERLGVRKIARKLGVPRRLVAEIRADLWRHLQERAGIEPKREGNWL